MKRIALFSLGLSFILAGCDRSKPITKETSRSAEVSSGPAKPTDDLLPGTGGSEEKQAAGGTEEPSVEQPRQESDAAAEPDDGEAPDAASGEGKAPARVPETVNVRGKEYPYCRTPNQEGCIPRQDPARAPAWK